MRSVLLHSLLALALGSACKRQDAPTPADATSARAEAPNDSRKNPVRLGDAKEASPTLGFRITAVHERARPSDAPPYHQPGGEWTFFDAVLEADAEARFTVGVRTRDEGSQDAWGDARLVAASPEAGERFVRAFARTFHTPEPEKRQGGPLEPLALSTAVLGKGVARQSDGSFGGQGTWVTSKWFPALEGTEGEVFFNYDLQGQRGELSEKHPDQAQSIAAVFAMALRDGRPPERTPENDPRMSATGPRFEPLRQVASKHARWKGVLKGGTTFAFVDRPPEGGSAAYLLDPARPEPLELARVEGELEDFVCLPPAWTRCVVQEKLPREPGSQSSEDPTRLWWVDREKGERVRLSAPAFGTRPVLQEEALSPEGRFLVVETGKDRPAQSRVLVTVILDRTTGKTVELKEQLRVVGWTRKGSNPLAQMESGSAFDAPQERETFDVHPLTGAITRASRPPRPAPYAPQPLSPDGRRRWALSGEGQLVVTEVASRRQRTFEFHPDDVPHLEVACCGWLGSRYLGFRHVRLALIDTDTMKMSYPQERDEHPPIDYSADFRFAVLEREDGLYLARVVLPDKAR